MKRILLVTLFFLYLSSNIFAQEGPGRAAFAAGDYSAAVQLYQVALSTTNEDNEASVSKAIEKAKICMNLLKQADAEYLDQNFGKAKNTYLSILRYNPDDKHAKRRVNFCESQIIAAANKLKEDTELKEALKDGQISSLQVFVDKYPQNSKSQLLSAIIKDSASPIDNKKAGDYIKWGDIYFEAGNRTTAQLWYDRACVFSAEALYKKALTYDNITAIEPLSLLVLSSVAGGYEPAKDKLSSVIGNCKYDTNVAKTLYKHLCNYSTDLESFVYVYENRATYPIERLNLAESAKLHFQNLTTTKEIKYDDNLIYQFATIVEKNLKKEAELLYNMAASKGNIDALRRVYEMKKGSLKYEDRQAFEDFLTDYNLLGYKSYLKYLRGEHMTSGDWNGIYSYCYDKHEELLAKSFSMRYNFNLKFYKKWIVRKNDNSLWDKEIIEEVKEWASYYSPKYAKRIIKLVSKLKTADGIYDISANPIYQFVEAGLSDNPHSYNQSIKKEKLWTIAPANNKTSKSAPRQTSSSSSTTYKPTTASKKDTYYVGQDLGEGYVFAVNDTGTHGLIVSKDINTGKPDSKLRYKAATKYKWRMPTESELYRIGKTLKDKFPVAGYLAYNGSGYKCVNFSKKNVYTATVNYSYIYRVLYVAEF